MLKYLLIFSLLGFAISAFVKNEKNTFIVFSVISIFWGLSTAPIWGLATLGELSLGYFIYKAIGKK